MALYDYESFGPYFLLGKIAEGGMAQLHYAVRKDTPKQIVALKQILARHAANAEFRRFFSLETQLTLALRHPNVVTAHEAGEVNGTPYLAMEYIHGRALNRVLSVMRQLGRRLPLPHGVFIAIQALEGIHYVHHAKDERGREIGAVLCDISPSNVMVGYDGQVKLIDFGIASSRLRYIEQLGMLRGKKNYMAPEQLRGQPLDARADIYAMAVCLVEILTSQPLFAHRSDFEIEEALRSGRLPRFTERAPYLPPPLADVLWKALAVEPKDRFGSALEFAQALAPFARVGKGEPVTQQKVATAVGGFLSSARQEDDTRLAEVHGSLAQAEVPFLDEEPPTGVAPPPTPGQGEGQN